jgi:hypothetical protein
LIEVVIRPREGDRLYEIHVGSAGNHEPLLVSHQGYENASDAERIVRRLFVEAVDMTVTYRDGKGKHEMIK